MRNKTLLINILVLATAFTVSACQKTHLDSTHTPTTFPPSQSSSATRDETLTSPIRKIDFENFTYPETADYYSFTLKGGEHPFIMNKEDGIYLGKVDYSDVTGDEQEEAILTISLRTGGSAMPNLIYVYTLKNENPHLLWGFMTGDRAEGGLKRVYTENSELVVETFGENKFENDNWKFSLPQKNAGGLCCPTAYTKIRFKWENEKFVPEGNPELFDFDWKKETQKAND
jgi:hypothetical protein